MYHVKDDLRYYDWHRTYPNEKLPRVLTHSDYNKIIITNALFCRKIESPISNDLIKELDKDL